VGKIERKETILEQWENSGDTHMLSPIIYSLNFFQYFFAMTIFDIPLLISKNHNQSLFIKVS